VDTTPTGANQLPVWWAVLPRFFKIKEQHMQTEYKITWTIDVTGENPLDAAKQALALFKAEDSTATVFRVENPQGETTEIDLHLQTETVIETPAMIIAIIIDGGVIQEIVSNNPAKAPNCMVIDYEVDRFADGGVFKIPQGEGAFAFARIHDRIIEATHTHLDLETMYSACF
jgi:hypothetical protein